ncbi:MAG: hypothetical protein ACK5QK_08770 [Chryseotalea sp.]|jgi:hypothetical protein
MKKIIYGLLIAILILGTGFILTISLVFGDSCVNQIVDIKISPDNNYQAVTFIRDCGATTGFSTQLSIIKVTDTFDKTDETGNTLIMSDKIGGGLMDENGGAKIRTSWTKDNKIEILYDNRTGSVKRETEYKDIKIEYRQIEE